MLKPAEVLLKIAPILQTEIILHDAACTCEALPAGLLFSDAALHLKTLLFGFRWESFQPVSFGQPSSSKNNSYRSERGTGQRAGSVPSVPSTAHVITLSPGPEPNAESLPCRPSAGAAVRSVWRVVIVDAGAVRLYHALQRVSGSALGDLSHL